MTDERRHEEPAGPAQAAPSDRRWGRIGGDGRARPEVAHVESIAPDENPVWKGYLEQPGADDERLGICCSGGGIRSAAFSLGALQVLRDEGVLDRARYLASVSGGGYIAIAHAITASLSEPQSLFRPEAEPWAPGTPEERHLRDHSTYLAPGAPGKAWFAVNLVYGLLLNLLPFVLAVLLVGDLIGWSYAHWLHRGLHTETGAGYVNFSDGHWALAAAGFALALAAVAVRRFLTRFRQYPMRLMEALRRVATAAALVAPVLFVWIIGLPQLLEWMREAKDSTDVAPGLKAFLNRFVPGAAVPEINLWAILVFLASTAGSAYGVWQAHRDKVRRLTPILAWVAGPLLLAAPFVVFTNGAAAVGFGWNARLGVFAAALGSLVVLGFVGHNVRWSMHPFYKERLSTVFSVWRRSDPATGRVTATPVPYEDPIPLSALDIPASGPARLPEPIICAAVNISDDVVPPGRNADSFTFTRAESGGPLAGYVPTNALEHESHGLLTAPAMMAISGAAISPSMGKFRRFAVYRFLFAMFNVRLGVWVPRPATVYARATRGLLNTAYGGDGGRLRRAGRWLWRRWKMPGPLYLFYEAVGWNSLRRDYVYVTDGGHWENLGLVELLRRGSRRVVCIDASGDKTDTFHTLGQAVALARSELRVDIAISPRDDGMAPGDDGFSETDHAVGDITYPDGTTGRLVYMKASLPRDLPADLRAYHERDPRFPAHSTGDQFFDDEQFESYRALGAFTARRAARHC